jgi:tetratricopeptide (TPR) repeat protein
MITKLRIKLLQRSGLNSYVTGDYQTAETCFRKILAIDPDYNGIRHNLGVMALAQDRFAEAEEIFLQEVVDHGGKYPQLRLLAEVYYLWGKREKALETYRRANAEGTPKHEKRLILERIAVCQNSERFKLAVLAREYYAEGNRLMDTQEWDEAEQQFVQAVELDNSNISAWNNLGSVRMNHRKDYAGAAEAFRAALSLQRVAWIENNLKNAERRLSG